MYTSQHTSGFSLIEMIVSLAVFSMVTTVAVGTLIVLIGSNRQLQDEQSVLSNLTFAIDSMTREIRTGSQYYCSSANSFANQFGPGNDLDTVLSRPWRDCFDGNSNDRRLNGFSFVEGGDSVSQSNDRILYYFDRTAGALYRRVGSSAAQPLTGDSIHIRDAEFFVAGAYPVNPPPPHTQADNRQPTVTLVIEAAESDDADAKVHVIQTTITQREIDL